MNEMHYANAVCAAVNGNLRPAAPEAYVRIIWEGELVATITATREQAAWDDFHQATTEDDGYTVQLIIDDQIIAEHINPDENGEV